MPAGISISQRVIQNISIPIKILAKLWDLDIRIAAEEATDLGIVDPAVHVDEAEVIEHFVAGEAAMVVGSAGDSWVGGLGALGGPGIGIPTFTPGIEALALGLESAPLAAIPSGGEDQDL